MRLLGRLIGCALVCALIGGSAATAADAGGSARRGPWYVAPDGAGERCSRAHPCSLQTAQQQVRAANDTMRHDLVVKLLDGTYRLGDTWRLTAEDSGAGGHDVVYEAVGRAEPVISGGSLVRGWTVHDAARGIWKADVGDVDTRQLYVDGNRATRASISTDLPRLTRTATGYTTDSTAPQSWARPEDVEVVYRRATTWSEPRCGIASISGTAESTTITMDQPCYRRAGALFDGGALGSTGLIPTSFENSLSFLTEPGTFYLDRSTPGAHVLYYLPRAGEQLAHAEVVAPALEQLVLVQGTAAAPVHDVAFRGLTFAEATWLQPDTPEGFVQYIGGLYENGDDPRLAYTLSPLAQSMPGNVALRYADRISIEDSRFERLGAQALEVVGSGNVVRGNVATDVSGGGFLIGDDRPETAGATSRGNVVENNRIHRIGVEYHGSTAIYATRTIDLTLAHNQVDDLPYTGIFLGQGHEQLVRANGPQDTRAPRNVGARILDNAVFDVMKEMSDGGSIYTTHVQGYSYETGTLIRGNAVRDQRDNWFGIYSDWGTTWQRVEDNVVYDVPLSFGGCSYTDLNAEIRHVRFTRNYWVDAEPWWPCEPPGDDITIESNTVLPREGARSACLADAGCRRIVNRAGLEPRYRHLLR